MISFYGNEKALSQVVNVLIGDTVIIENIGVYPPKQTCNAWISGNSHKSGTDFFIPPHSDLIIPAPLSGTVMFAPQKIGIQIDTFYFYASWTVPSECGVSSQAGPFPVTANCISDSTILFRSLNETNLVYYYWDQDSNKYLAGFTPPTFLGLNMPIELVNNIEAFTTFDLRIFFDSTAPIHPMIVIGADSLALPFSYNMKPLTRRLRGFIYFFTDSKGFDNYTEFPVKLEAIMHNSTSQDTSIVNYIIQFESKPQVSVHSFEDRSKENILFSLIVESQHISITSKFPQPENATIELYDALGRQLPLPFTQLQIPSGTNTEKLDIGNLSSGWYILRMKMKGQSISKSFVIVR